MKLAISTATAACSVALIDALDIIAEIHEEIGRGHAEQLVPMIARLPGNGRADAILVDVGPGSFTGVRVGVAAAKALSLAWGVPVQGYSSLAVIACSLHSDSGPIGIAMPGGHGEFFVQRFSTSPLSELTPAVSLPPDEARLFLSGLNVAGPAAKHFDSAACDTLPVASNARLLPSELRQLAPSPLYVRGPDAVAP